MKVKRILTDPAFWGLIILNVIFILQYYSDPRKYTSIIWLYWCQSVLLGFFNFLVMVTAKEGNIPEENSSRSIGSSPVFMLFHYEFFHLVYFIFLLVQFSVRNIDFHFLKYGLLMVIASHVIVFIQHRNKYNRYRGNNQMFYMAYLRIIPMHFTILLPAFLNWKPALIFLILKSVFDVIGHIITTPYYWNIKNTKPEENFT